MFKDFYEKLNHWLHEKGYLLTVNFTSPPNTDKVEVNPTNAILWTEYLKEIIPEKEAALCFHNPHELVRLVDELLGFSNYTVEQQMRNLLEQSTLNSISSKLKNQLIHKMLEFHQQLPAWVDGSWHVKLIKNRLDTINEITSAFNFETSWSCASFLFRCGYMIPN